MICDKLGSHIRYLLEYAGEDYEEVRYSQPNEWCDVKFKSGLDFPNLPWMEDEDIKISQVRHYVLNGQRSIKLGAE